MVKEITGKHVLLGFVGAFGLIITVNVVMAYNAVKTFPGLEVKNSYVASQQFDERKAAQEALGWTVRADHENGILRLRINGGDGSYVEPAMLEAVLGRATHVKDDVVLDLKHDGVSYFMPIELAGGNWNIRMKAKAEDGTEFVQRLELFVK